jgi:hypothetical protein
VISKILTHAIKKSWDEKTCFPEVKNSWNPEIPELGQCAVTALLINEKCGGEIIFNKDYNHYWNILPNGNEIDLTKRQFSTRISGSTEHITRSKVLFSKGAKKARTFDRYELLKTRVNNFLK